MSDRRHTPAAMALLAALAMSSCVRIERTYRVGKAPAGYVGELWHLDTRGTCTPDIAFSPDGCYLAVVQSEVTRVLEVESGRQISQFTGHGDLMWQTRHLWGPLSYIPHPMFWLTVASLVVPPDTPSKLGYMTAAAFSPDSRSVATASEDGTVRIWGAGSGWQRRVLGRFDGREITAVAWSPDGRRIGARVSAGTSLAPSQAITVWNATSGAELWSAEAPEGYITSVHFTPDGTHVVSAGRSAPVCIWRADSGELEREFRYDSSVESLEISRDGKRFLARVGHTVAVHDLETGNIIYHYEPRDDAELWAEAAWVLEENAVWLPDERFAVVAMGAYQHPGAIAVVNLEQRRVIGRLSGHENIQHLAVSTDGRLAASAGFDTGVRLWKLPTTAVPDPARTDACSATQDETP